MVRHPTAGAVVPPRSIRWHAGLALLALAACRPVQVPPPADSPDSARAADSPGPVVHVYREVAGRPLRAHVFAPAGSGPAAGMLLFHGGGWTAGAPEWTFAAARRFAERGLVAAAIEYRLSTGDATPIEALEDACAAFAWARANAAGLGLDPDRLAGYGVSAGGHLAAAAATVGCPNGFGASSAPDALILWSPALDVAADRWFGGLLGERTPASDYSPLEHVGPETPPTSIVQGSRDSLTPLAGARSFCDRLGGLGVPCELNVYEGVGHLLTHNLRNQESDFDPDPEMVADGIARQFAFLERLRFVTAREEGTP